LTLKQIGQKGSDPGFEIGQKIGQILQ